MASQPPQNASSPRRGRPRKSEEIRQKLAMAHSPEDVAPILFAGLGDAFELMEEVGALEKLHGISDLISQRLEKAGIDGATRYAGGDGDGVDLSGARPWSSSENLENVIYRAEAEFYANERIISALTAHLVEHLVVREDLRSIATSARRRARDELHQIPRYMADFIARLTDAGVSQANVDRMSEKRFQELVGGLTGITRNGAEGASSIIGEVARDRHSEAVSADVAGSDAPAPVSADDPVETHVDAMSGDSMNGAGDVPVDLLSRAAAGSGEALSGLSGTGLDGEVSDGFMGSEDGVPSLRVGGDPCPGTPPGAFAGPPEDAVPDVSPSPAGTSPSCPYGEVIPDPSGPWRAPSAPWDVLDFRGTPWMAVERVASSDADTVALRYRVPTVATMAEMAQSGSSLERGWLDKALAWMDLGQGGDLIRHWAQRQKLTLNKEEIQVWLLLLLALADPFRASRIIPVGDFHGVLLPGRAAGADASDLGLAGGTRVRQILAVDPSIIMPGTAFRAVD